MAHNESISLSASLTHFERQEQQPNHGIHQALRLGLPALTQWEPRTKRVCVLVGSAILQLPIWGFAMSYGVFQEYYSTNWMLQGNQQVTGIIGTTSNGVMYLSMPFLFALFTRKWAHRRRSAAFCGATLMGVSFLLSSYSTHVWHLVATQGVLAALGCTLIYSPITLTLGEHFATTNRALAYGVVLSCKNIVGSTCPLLFRGSLDRYGLRLALKIWTAVAVGTSVSSIFLIVAYPSNVLSSTPRARRIPWHFLKHPTFYVYSFSIILQSSGYCIPQTYLNTYAYEVTRLSQSSATLLLTLFNIPGIVSSFMFGYLSDNKRFTLSTTSVTAISAISSALSAWVMWGLTSQGSLALLILFSMTFGFFAGGYSGTWGGIVNELELEAAQTNEAIDTGMIYGLLNGARGIGYVCGGLAGIPLLKAGNMSIMPRFGYNTPYNLLIIFTGLTCFGGWGWLWKWNALLRLVR